jgi:hypothetical protein
MTRTRKQHSPHFKARVAFEASSTFSRPISTLMPESSQSTSPRRYFSRAFQLFQRSLMPILSAASRCVMLPSLACYCSSISRIARLGLEKSLHLYTASGAPFHRRSLQARAERRDSARSDLRKCHRGESLQRHGDPKRTC